MSALRQQLREVARQITRRPFTQMCMSASLCLVLIALVAELSAR